MFLQVFRLLIKQIHHIEKKRKEKDNSKEKVLQLNIKDAKHVFHKDAIFFQKIDTYFVFLQ